MINPNLRTIENGKPYKAEGVNCPKCEGSDVIYLSYGYSKVWYYFSRGCSLHSDSSRYMCEGCKHEFGNALAAGESDDPNSLC